jgi:hypothetical protein
MNRGGFAILPLLFVGAILLLGGGFWLSGRINKPSKEHISSQTTPVSDPIPFAKSSVKSTASPQPAVKASNPSSALLSACNLSKDVCFENTNLNAIIQEGYLEDANFWVSDQLRLKGNGSGGFELKINGFPAEFSVRAPDQNFPNGGTGKVYLRAQKNAAKKGTYKGTISVKSFITNTTTVSNLTLNFVEPNTSTIHTDPGQVNLDCKIIYNVNAANSKGFDCGRYEEHYLKFYAYKNNKTIEIRTNPEGSGARSITLDTEYSHSKTLSPGQDVYTLHYDPAGFDYNNLNSETEGIYKGYISFVDQGTQKEIIHIPYTLNVHSYKP